jgi:hypothetical protein
MTSVPHLKIIGKLSSGAPAGGVHTVRVIRAHPVARDHRWIGDDRGGAGSGAADGSELADARRLPVGGPDLFFGPSQTLSARGGTRFFRMRALVSGEHAADLGDQGGVGGAVPGLALKQAPELPSASRAIASSTYACALPFGQHPRPDRGTLEGLRERGYRHRARHLRRGRDPGLPAVRGALPGPVNDPGATRRAPSAAPLHHPPDPGGGDLWVSG